MPALTSADPPTSASRGSQNLKLTSGRFETWLRQAAPGNRLAYHHRYLAVDRVRRASELSEPDRRELVAVARVALALAERGGAPIIDRLADDLERRQ